MGVLPRDFRLQLPTEAFEVTDGDMWTPIQFDYGQPLPRNLTFFTVFGRLAPGVTFEQAQGEMDRIAEQFRAEFKEHAASNVRIRAVPLHYDVVKHARPALLVLLGAVGMVLLIACANVANLLLVRGTTRQAEFALRTALGASRGAMIRQVLTESLLLALAGGVLGHGPHRWRRMAVLRSLHPANLPRLADVQLDGTVLAFTAAVCAATAVLFGLVPALRAARVDPQEHLKAGARSGTGGDRRRARNLLIMAEVALSVVLLVGAGLLIRSFLALQRVNPGLRRERRAHVRALDAVRQVPQRRVAPGVLPRAHRQARGAAGGEERRAGVPASAHRQRTTVALRLQRRDRAELRERHRRRPQRLADLLPDDERAAAGRPDLHRPSTRWARRR